MSERGKILGLALLLGLVFPGCGAQTGTDTGNPTTVGLQIVGAVGLPGPVPTPAPGSGVKISEARIVLKEIDIDPLETCFIEAEVTPEPLNPMFDFPGPFVIDLLRNTTLPPTELIQIPAGSYCEVELNFDKLDAAQLPAGIPPTDPILGRALLVRGTRSDGMPFQVVLEQDDKFKLQGTRPDGFPILDLGGVTRFFIRFDLDQWFANVDLNGVTAKAGGVILLDAGHHPDLLALVVENVKRSAQLFRDLNGDGMLQPDEETQGLVLGVGVDEED